MYRDHVSCLLPDHAGATVGIGFGASFGAAKMWPAQRFALLIQKLLATGARVVLLGGGSDQEVEQAVLKSISGVKPLSLVGQTNIPQLAAVMTRLTCYVTNDTGPMHLAAALGVPTVAIFGSTSPKETAPREPNVTLIHHGANCAPCWKRECSTNHQCMTAISIDEVFTAVKTLL
jgi:heptosyltransferase-2